MQALRAKAVGAQARLDVSDTNSFLRSLKGEFELGPSFGRGAVASVGLPRSARSMVTRASVVCVVFCPPVLDRQDHMRGSGA